MSTPAYSAFFQHVDATKVADALTRAVREGRLSKKDLPWDTGFLEDLLGDEKRKYREGVHAPAVRTPAELERRRAIQDKRFNVFARKPEMLSPDAAGTKVHTSTFGSMASVPGMGPRTNMSGGKVHIGMSPLDEALVAPMTGTHGPMNKTLRTSVLAHEIGEAAEMNRAARGGSITPHATHLGLEPIIREGVELTGDHEAVAGMRKLRLGHSDDKRVQDALRSVGHHPDVPIQPGTRRAKALQRVTD